MALKSVSTPIGDGSGIEGRVAGAVLAAIRRQLSLSQEDLATRLAVSGKTLQAWEQGRNPLIRLPYVRLRQLGRAVLACGATPELVTALETALSADDIWAGMGSTDPEQHPLAATVPDRATTEMLAWPLTGQAPRQLRTTPAELNIPAGQRDHAVTALRMAAESAPTASGQHAAMLRRQAVFLVAEHDAARSVGDGWATHQVHAAARSADLRSWSPNWAVARSAAIRSAGSGDLEPLQRFAQEGLGAEDTTLANLRYWAYWSGEFPAPWAADSDMVRGASEAWSGELLLPSLLAGVTSAAYRELCAHSLWALASARRMVVTRPGWAATISDTVEQATTDDTLTPLARRRLEQVHYLIAGSMA